MATKLNRPVTKPKPPVGMLIFISTEPGGVLFEHHRDLTMDKFVALKSAGHRVFVATAWQEW
jgi:hypothetical protein